MDRATKDRANNQPNRMNVRLLLLGILVVSIGVVYWQFRELFSLEYLAGKEAQLRGLKSDMPWVAAGVAFAIYVAIAGLSLPGAAGLTLVFGWYFGFWEGLIIVSFGSAGGAVVAFLLSRYLLRDWIQRKMQDRLQRINAAFDREGAFYLFTLRLIPVVPFFAINTVMGLTRISAFTFWWVSQVGMLPGTVAYVYAGSTVPSLQTLSDEGIGRVLSPQILLAFAVIGLLPLAIKKVMSIVRSRRNDNAPPIS